MSETWIIRVAGREYGPADLETLREWRLDGRVLPENEARRSSDSDWIAAREIPGLFMVEKPPRQVTEVPMEPPGSVRRLCTDAARLYFRGWRCYLGLTLLVVVPSICAQLTAEFLNSTKGVDVGAREMLAVLFTLCMLFLTVAAWPIYVGGIQVVTAELAAGRPARFFAALNEAVKFWPRIAILCLFVYGSYIFWTVVPVGVIFGLALGGPSVPAFFAALALGALQVWMVGRLFVNFMFWQQCVVLENADVVTALRESKNLARSGKSLPFYKRPLWRGVFIFGLWSIFVIALNFQTIEPALRTYWQQITTSSDPQALVQAMLAQRPQPQPFNATTFALWLAQRILMPWLGIAFVLVFFEARARRRPNESEGKR